MSIVYDITAGKLRTDIRGDLLAMEVDAANQRSARGVRLDSAKSADPRAARVRALIRSYADAVVDAAKVAQGTRLDAKGADHLARDVAAALAYGLGLHTATDGIRLDASTYLPGEFMAARQPVIFPDAPETVVTSTLAKRVIDANALYVPTATGSRTGSFAPWAGSGTEIPVVGFEVSETVRTVTALVAQSLIDFEELARDGARAVSKVQEDAEAARQIFARLREDGLVGGIPGTSFAGLGQTGVPIFTSALDYAAGGTTLGNIYADLILMIQTLRQASDETRAGNPTTLVMGQRWVDQIVGRSNFDAGGSMSGNDLLATVTANDAGLAAALRQAQVRTIIAAPSLDAPDWAPTGFSGAVLMRAGDQQGLREIVAQELAPVRTASTIVGNQTLWCFRGAGAEWPNSQKQGLAVAKTV